MDNRSITETIFFTKYFDKDNNLSLNEISKENKLYNTYFKNKRNYYFMTFVLTSRNRIKTNILKGNIGEILLNELKKINQERNDFNLDVIGVNLIYINTNLLIKYNIAQPVEELSINVVTNRIVTFKKYFRKYCKFMKLYHRIKNDDIKVKKFPNFMKHIKDENEKINLMTGFDYLYKILVDIYLNNNHFIRLMNFNSIFVIAIENCIVSHYFLNKLINGRLDDFMDIKNGVYQLNTISNKSALDKQKKKYKKFCNEAYFKDWFDICLLSYQKISFSSIHINIPNDEKKIDNIDYGIYFNYNKNDNYLLSISNINIDIPTAIIQKYFYSFNKKYLTNKFEYTYNLITRKFKKEDNLFSRTFGSFISNPEIRNENYTYKSNNFVLPSNNVAIDPSNWMYYTNGIDRSVQIDSVVRRLSIIPKLLNLFSKKFYIIKDIEKTENSNEIETETDINNIYENNVKIYKKNINKVFISYL